MFRTVLENLTKRVEELENAQDIIDKAICHDRQVLEELYHGFLKLHAIVDKLHAVKCIINQDEEEAPKKSHVIKKLRKSKG